VCIERCKPGSEGGAGVSSQEASRAYPTGTGLPGPVHESLAGAEAPGRPLLLNYFPQVPISGMARPVGLGPRGSHLGRVGSNPTRDL
jgi:hypothetical protein